MSRICIFHFLELTVRKIKFGKDNFWSNSVYLDPRLISNSTVIIIISIIIIINDNDDDNYNNDNNNNTNSNNNGYNNNIYVLIVCCKFCEPISSETAASLMLWLCRPISGGLKFCDS